MYISNKPTKNLHIHMHKNKKTQNQEFARNIKKFSCESITLINIESILNLSQDSKSLSLPKIYR